MSGEFDVMNGYFSCVDECDYKRNTLPCKYFNGVRAEKACNVRQALNYRNL